MKILHITHNLTSGAGIAVSRLHQALLNAGINSNVWIKPATKRQDLPAKLRRFALTKLHEACHKPPFLPFSNAHVHTPYEQEILTAIETHSPDVVHLHWLQNDFFPISLLRKIKQPIVWSLHDTWAFTAGCHINAGCNKFTSGCHACPQYKFLTHHYWKEKRTAYKGTAFKVTVPSSFMQALAIQSPLFANKTVDLIPNIIPNSFRQDKKLANLFSLPSNKKLVLIGSLNPSVDTHKQVLMSLEIIKTLHQKDASYVPVIMGETTLTLDLPHITLGAVAPQQLPNLYNHVQFTLLTSIQESFGQMAAESIACGTPVIAPNHSGFLDIVPEPWRVKEYKNIDAYIPLFESNLQLVPSNQFSDQLVTPKWIALYNSL